MGDIIKITVNLTVICALAGLILSATWVKTNPVKLMEEAREREQALKGLIPQADTIDPVKDVVISGKEKQIYKATKDGETIGYIVSSAGKGYSSYIMLLVAVDTDYRLIGIDILGHGETPGLGDQIGEDWFVKQFAGMDPDGLKVVKPGGGEGVQAVTGATISSRGVVKGVKDAVDKLREEAKAGL